METKRYDYVPRDGGSPYKWDEPRVVEGFDLAPFDLASTLELRNLRLILDKIIEHRAHFPPPTRRPFKWLMSCALYATMNQSFKSKMAWPACHYMCSMPSIQSLLPDKINDGARRHSRLTLDEGCRPRAWKLATKPLRLETSELLVVRVGPWEGPGRFWHRER